MRKFFPFSADKGLIYAASAAPPPRGISQLGRQADTKYFFLQLLDPALSHYRDRRFPGSQEQFEQRLTESTTLYIGNLSFYTTEEQVYEVSQTLTNDMPGFICAQKMAFKLCLVSQNQDWALVVFAQSKAHGLSKTRQGVECCLSCRSFHDAGMSSASSWAWTSRKRRPAAFALLCTTPARTPRML